jgi:hypothetical protein
MHKGQRVLLTGIIDYALGYNVEGTMTHNFIVVKAKRRYCLNMAYGQLLSYMGLL